MAIDALQKEINKGIPPFNDVFGSIRCGVRLARNIIEDLPSAQPEIVRCKECKNSEHWYRDRRRCFLWAEDGVSVFDNGFCNYAERRTDGFDFSKSGD